MSVNEESQSHSGFDPTEHQASYVFTPGSSQEELSRAKKRRKIATDLVADAEILNESTHLRFIPLLDGAETPNTVQARERMYRDTWAATEAAAQSILEDANENTLAEVTLFVNEDLPAENRDQIPTALIVTGPNITSQELLFSQVANRLRTETNSLVTVLRSMDASNLKTVLKKLIRDFTNEKGDHEDEAHAVARQDGRKLLNYDLQLLQDHLVSSSHSKVVVAFQDSEAFDNSLLAELLILFRSWLDRIPFVVLFGIATSVELFHERLPAGATRCLYGAQFDVEQTSKTLEKVFQKVVAGSDVPLRLGPGLVSSLFERQYDHVQSLQAFISALKYAYMCHFYANPLSFLLNHSAISSNGLQPEHVKAIRMLPSFRMLVEKLLNQNDTNQVRSLLDDDVDQSILMEAIHVAMKTSHEVVTKLLRAMQILVVSSLIIKQSQIDRMDLYVKAFSGQLGTSNIVRDTILSIEGMGPDEVVALTQGLVNLVANGDPESNLAPWTEDDKDFVDSLNRIRLEAALLTEQADAAGTPLRSRYATQHKTLRTTVVAQKVQLSREKSTLSKLDISFTELIDELSDMLAAYFSLEKPQTIFLHEVWLYDSKSPYKEVFTPKPRHAIERALSNPHDYLSCTCCKPSEEGLSSSQPPTAILYQLYLETGGLINVFDLWSAFYAIVGGDDGEESDERSALVLYYKALADLKLLGMVKQSRKKTDHLAKLAWRGL